MRIKTAVIITVLLLIGSAIITTMSESKDKVENNERLENKLVFQEKTEHEIPLIYNEEKWMRTYGKFLRWEEGCSVHQTREGGYIVAGETAPHFIPPFAGYPNAWLIKIDANGNKEWDKIFGGFGHQEARSVQQTNDGGYIIAGFAYSHGFGPSDIWLIKTDANGNKEWDKTFGGPNNDRVSGDRCIQQTNDGGYIIVGETKSYGAGHSDVWLIKVDVDGSEEWNKTFGRSIYERGNSVHQTTDGGYIITGETYSYGVGNGDVWLIKTNENGEEEWNKTFGGEENDGGASVQQTNNGGYIIAGFTDSYAASCSDAWLIKADSNGNEEWNKTFEGICCDGSSSVWQTNDGGYILSGRCGPSPYSSYLWLIKTDANGNEEWDKTFGGGKGLDSGRSVQQTIDGGYIVTGAKTQFLFPIPWFPYWFVDSNVWLIKTDEKGNAIESMK